MLYAAEHPRLVDSIDGEEGLMGGYRVQENRSLEFVDG
jgi:hypothetical protein